MCSQRDEATTDDTILEHVMEVSRNEVNTKDGVSQLRFVYVHVHACYM